VLPPDINRSQVDFSIAEREGRPAIRFGLAAIKNVGPGAVSPVISERSSGGDYKSVEDLCRRVDLSGVNKRVMESLVKAGAMDSLAERGTLLANIGRILSLAQREQRLRQTGQTTMFDLWGETVNIPLPSLDMVAGEVSKREGLAWEKELMGVYLSEHPFSPYVGKAASENTTLCGQIDAEMEGQTVTVAGMVDSVHNLMTRDGQAAVSVVLEDIDGKIEVTVWPRAYAATRQLWEEGSILLVMGKVRLRGNRVQLICDKARRYQLEPDKDKAVAAPRPDQAPLDAEEASETLPTRRLMISLRQTGDQDGDIARLHQIMSALREYPGPDEVSLDVDIGQKVVKLKMAPMRVNGGPELQKRLLELVGENGKVQTRPVATSS
jgi:DNA polymerase-3 subunit alpha